MNAFRVIDASKWSLVRGCVNRGMVCEAAFFCPGRAVIVDYRRPAREIVTVELGMRQAAGGLRCPSRLPPHPPCPCRLVRLMVGLHTLHRRPAVHGGPALYQYTRSFGPATDLAGGPVKARQTKQAVIKAVCCFHLESNRDDASTLRPSALRAWDAPGSQAVQARKVPVSQKTLLGGYHGDGMVFLKVGRCQETLCPQCWSRMGPQAPCWQGRMSCGPTRSGCGCHTVLLMCALVTLPLARNSTRKNRGLV